ncbi:alpha/beta fold hydrolase [Pseudooceanicola algae]|uniref:2-succinyl-6-hydroxy-2, 4-cyclohexadiene-1-carboxylate synthase n=1 Tax=Pseudooceanicola algae TaxID=1537215 RepID=A0A418SJH1_9RHOB|nr:alpha/beta hydrolase [Pseudooceanicola algae]QPM91880.1 2-succinyl-6-hydroxy-2,4-cyclohexadiene-1-carboxylate synthase [Pseudooceanicola algae]
MPHFLAPDGASLYYEDSETGLPLLCLSGLTRNARDFDFLAPHLDGVRMIRMDYRGRGLSAWTGAGTYTIPTESQDALALLDHLGLDRAAILGTSRGGLIAMVLAATAKDRLLGVALNDVGPEVDSAGIASIATYIGIDPPYHSFDEAAAARAAAPGFADVPLSRWRQEVTHGLAETPDGVKITYDPALRDAVLAGVDAPTPDLWPLFAALEGLPLAALRAEHSDILAPATFARMQEVFPNMIARLVPGRGHVPFLDEPTSLAALKDWLELLQ